MRHRKKTVKLQRTKSHREAMMSNQVCSLIEHGRIKTTLAKAKALRPFAEKIVTLAKTDSVHARRRAAAGGGSCSRHPNRRQLIDPSAFEASSSSPFGGALGHPGRLGVSRDGPLRHHGQSY